jgi:hypothetical protein
MSDTEVDPEGIEHPLIPLLPIIIGLPIIIDPPPIEPLPPEPIEEDIPVNPKTGV